MYYMTLEHVCICITWDYSMYTCVLHDITAYIPMYYMILQHVYICITWYYSMYTHVLQRPTRHMFTYFEHMLDMTGKIIKVLDICWHMSNTDRNSSVPDWPECNASISHSFIAVFTSVWSDILLPNQICCEHFSRKYLVTTAYIPLHTKQSRWYLTLTWYVL